MKNKGIMDKIISIVKWLAIIIIAIAAVQITANLGTKYISSSPKTTKLGFENVGQLVTQTAYLTVVKDNKKNIDFFNLFKIPFTETRKIFSYDIEVDAGVDFNKIKYDVDNDNKQIKIKTPHAKIYKAKINTDSFRSYLDSDSIFTKINMSEHNDSLKKMEEQAVKDAEANNMLRLADENAKNIIRGLVNSNEEFKEYNVLFEYIEEN